MNNKPMIVKKECGTCTKCCEGWLSADIKGHKMYPGKPCFFIEIGKGCTIYKDRPKDPCKDFNCGWIQIENMPEEFKPEVSGVIMHIQGRNEKPYICLSKAPNNPTEQYISWAVTYAMSKNMNIVWYFDDMCEWIGDEEFSRKMRMDHLVI